MWHQRSFRLNSESKIGNLPNIIIEWFCKFCFIADRFIEAL